jgi:oligopeptide/dipeptide ABC transporter ATP-binding protein
MAMLFITHDLALVGEIADRVAVMYAGQVVEGGPADEVLQAPRHPYTKALLECIPHRDYEQQQRVLKPIPGTVANLIEPPPGCRFAPRCPFVQDRWAELREAL